ncbi:unnamed protein product [Symbiodinium sp. CCMP2592]|nr:unnamed protein product [Symbiodinium sp. CCMP2592]
MNPHPVRPVTMLYVPEVLNLDMFQSAWNQTPAVISTRERRLFAPLLRRAQQSREEVFGWLRILEQEWAENESEELKLALWLTVPYMALPACLLTEILGHLVDTNVYVHQYAAMPVQLAVLRPLWVVEDDDDRDACNLSSLQCRLEETARNQKRLYDYVRRICGNIVRCNFMLAAGLHVLKQRARTVRCVG